MPDQATVFDHVRTTKVAKDDMTANVGNKYLDAADTRGIEVLNRVAALARWDKRASPRSDQNGDWLPVAAWLTANMNSCAHTLL